VENAGVEKAEVDCKGGKCNSGKSRSRSQGWKMQEKIVWNTKPRIYRENLKLLFTAKYAMQLGWVF